MAGGSAKIHSATSRQSTVPGSSCAARYAAATWAISSSTPSSEHGSATCSPSWVQKRRLCSSRGRPTIWPPISSCASMILSQVPGLSCRVGGAASRNGDDDCSRGRTSPSWWRRSARDRRRASSASAGCSGYRTSTSSSSTMRTCAGLMAARRGPTGRPWTRPCGTTCDMGLGFSRGACAVSDWSCGGWGRRRRCEHVGGNHPSASPDRPGSCCCISSGGRARRRSRSAGQLPRSKLCDAHGLACSDLDGIWTSKPRRPHSATGGREPCRGLLPCRSLRGMGQVGRLVWLLRMHGDPVRVGSYCPGVVTALNPC